MTDANDEKVQAAHDDAAKFRRYGWVYRVQIIPLAVVTLFVENPWVQRGAQAYILALSVQALVATYDAKAEAADARAAGYDNP